MKSPFQIRSPSNLGQHSNSGLQGLPFHPQISVCRRFENPFYRQPAYMAITPIFILSETPEQAESQMQVTEKISSDK